MPKRWAIGILAAGASRRFGATPKLAAHVAGTPLLRHTLDAALQTRATSVLLCLPPGDDGETLHRLLPFDPRLRTCINSGDTQADSVRTLLEFAGTQVPELEAILLYPADRPAIRPEAFQRLHDALIQHDQPVIALLDGKPRPPLCLPRRCWHLGARLKGDEGFRQLLPELKPYPVSCDDVAADLDLDRPEDLPAFENWLQAGQA